MYSQQLNFDHYNQSNGLINNEVHCIMQASNGFMYFGTPSGLSIFNGASFNNYDVSKGFKHNIISGIQELISEKIFLYTNSNQFYQISDQHLSVDSVKVPIKNIYRGKSGLWYACTYSGLYLFYNGTLSKLPVSAGTSFPGINCVAEWQDSLLVVGRSYEPLDIYNRYTWKHIASSSEKLFVRNICADKEGNIWIASIGAGVQLLRPGNLRDSHIQFEKLPASFFPFQQNEFRAIVEDKEGNFWMGSINKGLIKYNPQTSEFLHISMDQGLASNTIFSLYCDKEDNIWIGTNRGVQKLAHNYTLSFSSKQGLPADLVLDMLSLPGDGIITSGYSGVGYIKRFGEKIAMWHPPLEDEYFLKFISVQKKYFGLSLKKLVELHISAENISTENIYPLPEHFRDMITFRGNNLLLGGDSTILLFSNGKMSSIAKEGVHLVSCMAIDDSEILWTGSLTNMINGYSLHSDNEKISASISFHYQATANGKQDYIQCITVDNKKNRIIYGTSQNGITILTRANNKLIQSAKINISSGLSNNNVVSLVWYNDSTLLVGTGYGLDKIIFATATDSFYVHNINDYYNFSNTVYSIVKTGTGDILLGTESGVLKIPSVDIEKNLGKDLPVVISSIRLLGNPDSTIDIKKIIDLPYNNNGLTVSYSSPFFINEKNIRYTYLLAGANQNSWSRPSSSSHVTFLNLSPGHYKFMVKPVNIYGEISAEAASAEIYIRPAFWQTWWFNLILILAVSVLLYFIIRRRISNIRYESALKNKITETEMMALRAQMNPHFIFNCMNIIDGLITSDRKQEAQDFLQKFSKLIRLVLENSQHQQVPIQQDLQALHLYIELEAIRSNYHFKYGFDIDEELIEDNYKIPPLLLQPYIENAIVHGLRNKETGDCKLFVRLKKENNKIVAIIEDNGIGRKKAMDLNEGNKKPYQSLGMKVTAKRIDLLRMMNQNTVSIEIADMQHGGDTGTVVTIILPVDLKFE